MTTDDYVGLSIDRVYRTCAVARVDHPVGGLYHSMVKPPFTQELMPAGSANFFVLCPSSSRAGDVVRYLHA